MTPIVPKSTTPVITTSSGRKRGDFYLDFSKPPEPMGKIELPDGVTYAIAPVNSGEVLRIEELVEQQAPDPEALPVYAAIAHRITGAPLDLIYSLTPNAIANLVMIGRVGAEAFNAYQVDAAAANAVDTGLTATTPDAIAKPKRGRSTR